MISSVFLYSSFYHNDDVLLGLWDSPVEGTVLRVHLASAYDWIIL